jgi:hypothetical protein
MRKYQPSEHVRQEIRKFRRAGLSMRSISDVLLLNRRTLAKYFAEELATPRSRPPTREDLLIRENVQHELWLRANRPGYFPLVKTKTGWKWADDQVEA